MSTDAISAENVLNKLFSLLTPIRSKSAPIAEKRKRAGYFLRFPAAHPARGRVWEAPFHPAVRPPAGFPELPEKQP